VAHEVFLSYATEDADAASGVCAMLEADGVRCWLAPRDVKVGTDYAASIMNAIRNSQLVVFVFSVHSNASPYALREIERAVAYGRPVVALRMDKTHPNPSLEYHLAQWIEVPHGVERRRSEILAAVRRLLATTGEETPRPRPWYGKTWVIAVAAVVAVVAVGLGLGLGLTRDRAAPAPGATSYRVDWSQVKVTGTLPLPRSGHSLAYDQVSGRLIMFGGNDGVKNLRDTWAYDPAAKAWTELKPTGLVPRARSGHSMVYDLVTRRLIMFGGFADTGPPLNDTWAYDPAAKAWTELKPEGTAPSPRGGAAMAYDPVRRRFIVFGGAVRVGAPLNDTWAYDPAAKTWTDLKPSGTPPPPSGAGTMAYDPNGRRFIVFGGIGDTGEPLNETWAYDPAKNVWTNLRPKGVLPSPRSSHTFARDETSGRLVLFGGQDVTATVLDDTWTYEPAANTWTHLASPGVQPTARAGQAMAYDQASGQLIMFGGDGGTTNLNDTWTCVPG
jgi:N-acetylneuraminic acid mutarotase